MPPAVEYRSPQGATSSAIGDLPSVQGIRDTRVLVLLREWNAVIARLQLSRAVALSIAHRAIENETGFAREAIASGRVAEASFFQAIAHELGLLFLGRIDPDQVHMAAEERLAGLARLGGPPLTLLTLRSGQTLHVIARPDIDFGTLQRQLREHPGIAERIAIASPSVLRSAIVRRSSQRLLFDAQNAHALGSPDLSARTVVTGRQGLYVGVLTAMLLVGLSIFPLETILVIHLIAALTFLACIVLRVLALRDAKPIPPRYLQAGPTDEMPVYSVVVALYREREIVPQLLVALGKLQWPRSKLEIKLVCEADDRDTLAALRAHRLHPCIEIIEVPPAMPRTKPKALAYALPLCSGEFITLFDAEDRPDPNQLIAAYSRFKRSSNHLACLQAPLQITNAPSGILPAMFAFEFAGLFRGLLPFLARLGLPLPLGGTSNHFRRSALLEVGGWDPYNVTEDADLGVRLARYGYRVGIMRNPTLEDAPERLRDWLPQRIRWFKGWMQTWLVHMRHPVLLWRELGAASFLTMQIIFAGMILSALVHPLFFVTVIYAAVTIAQTGEIASLEARLAIIAFIALLLGYAAFIVLGWRSLAKRERPSLAKVIMLTPLHWLLLSVAAWVALAELYWRPHHWHKTPHRRASPAATKASATKIPVQIKTRTGKPLPPQPRAAPGSPMIFGSSSPITPLSRPS
jgi:cellulose synthase/poly-beta-1,6-N-acetylglucosamine synthase-like glycosyltransferase